ncbi:tetratricopeptide repeat containing protein [Paenibacillus peoriae]|uniref:DUF5107 domain-containing protein n=1 Tax=Paenibacillus peoriae TaxID=59893 RepID=UPI0006A75339|nr:DUF5107 domain-containing protein [Paenibacillus peoriae]ALA40569.1 tetratricopeptide repeat containing protein [Paenibacillus peoriae]
MELSIFDAKARVWEETVHIPTYGIGKPDKNPMFLEKRVYQGSSGRVYPHPVIDKIEDEKKLENYQMVFLENKYLRIEIMPELGGRIYRAVDKTNGYDFVYYNRVIKPALVGLLGPWISGGIEFNWPQHHRPNTYGPVEYKLEEHEDGSATVWVSEIDRMFGTKVTAGFTLQPDKAYLKVGAQLYNRTAEPQTFLWWANPAVAVHEHTQSVFPPDVSAVFDHGKRDVSRFPIATGTYYKMDYSEGVDISRYKNIPVPTSYMAYKSDYNFIGGYDHMKQAGLLHVANHHISPGKKQWTWGNGEFGQAWDRNLTDEDGPYIELMTGVYTDNQPDFTWLQPYEEKSFSQYFMPYKHIGMVKNASIDAAVNLELNRSEGTAQIGVYVTSSFRDAVVELSSQRKVYIQETLDLTPNKAFMQKTVILAEDEDYELCLTVKDATGRELISYQPKKKEVEQMPAAAAALPEPEELRTNEELYLVGQHLEQYRHATFEPEAYYLEGLKRDKNDSRINVAYGTLLLRRGLYSESEECFRKAISRVTWRNSNPYDGEAYYQLGLSLKYQERMDEAFAAFYKSVWSAAWQDSGYFSLAQIATEKGNYEEALELVERSIIRNARNYKARNLKSAILRKLGSYEAAIAYSKETIKLDIADFGAYREQALSLEALGLRDDAKTVFEELEKWMRGDVHNYIAVASDYAAAGLYEDAVCVLEEAPEQAKTYPMLYYVQAFCYAKIGKYEQANNALAQAAVAVPDYCFPNSLLELDVLQFAIRTRPGDGKAHYYLGNLLYDKKRHWDAISSWETSRSIDDTYPVVHRNLALGYFNKQGQVKKARHSLEQAFACNTSDARVLYELDQLYKKLNIKPNDRLNLMESYPGIIKLRDDLFLEYVTVHNTMKQHKIALSLLTGRIFHPWEGGEGKVTGQYRLAKVELAKSDLRYGQIEQAVKGLREALVYPENLGEGKLEGSQDNDIYYYLGCAYELLKLTDEARQAFSTASQGQGEPINAMYYNDQQPDMIFYQGLAWQKLGYAKEGNRRFNKLIDYAERHLFEPVKMDYFAVSLPDFLIFEDDLNNRNQVHCTYMKALGLLGLGRQDEAILHFESVLKLEANHQGALNHMDWSWEGKSNE